MIQILPATGISREELAGLDIFLGLDDAKLDWLRQHGELAVADKDDVVVRPGDPASHMYIMLSGGVHWRFGVGGQNAMFTEIRAGAVGGALPYSRATSYGGQGVAAGALRAYRLHRERFTELLARIPELGGRLVAVMSDRVKRSTQIVDQREKMSALGKMAAGIAHELNNPSAALKSASAELRARMMRLISIGPRMMLHNVKPEHIQAATEFRDKIMNRNVGQSLGAVDRAEREDQITDWLEARGVAEPWVFSGLLADSGVTVPELDEFAQRLPAEIVPLAIQWVEGTAGVSMLTQDIHSAAERIGQLVGSIKVYAHMDRASEKEPLDLVQGIENTLVIMGHKLKKKSIRVVREYAPGMPMVPIYPGEMNQVWTNLIDNAIDAMDDSGTLTLRTMVQGSCACVEVCDTGSGIAPEVQSRIFEPFFTTKPMGEGTGMGLDIVHRIVTVQHDGDIQVESTPGHTKFQVWIPLFQGARREA